MILWLLGQIFYQRIYSDQLYLRLYNFSHFLFDIIIFGELDDFSKADLSVQTFKVRQFLYFI